MTQEPNLEEWTCRAESCDLLHEPVSDQNPIVILLLYLIIVNIYIFIP